MNKEKIQLLKSWKEIVKRKSKWEHFNFEDFEDKQSKLKEYVKKFIENPDLKNFKKFWTRKHIYSAQQAAKAKNVWTKNRRKFLQKTIKEIFESEDYNQLWKIKSAKKQIGELYGNLHIENHPIFNSCAEIGLKFFDYTPDGKNYTKFEKKFKEFKDEYYSKYVGYGTEKTSHKVPLNYEIDQLFNVIDKLNLTYIAKNRIENRKKVRAKVIEKLKLPENDKPYLKKFYRLLLKLTDDEKNPINDYKKLKLELDNLKDILLSKSQVILYGPPGTGKTYKAREFAVKFLNED